MGMREGSHYRHYHSKEGMDRRMRTDRSVSTSYLHYNSNMTVLCVLIFYAIIFIFLNLHLIQLQLQSSMDKKTYCLSCHCILLFLASESNYFLASLFIYFITSASLQHGHNRFNCIFYPSHITSIYFCYDSMVWPFNLLVWNLAVMKMLWRAFPSLR